jgi:hypothetical protein
MLTSRNFFFNFRSSCFLLLQMILQFDQNETSFDELLRLSLFVGTIKWFFLLRYYIIMDFEKEMLSTNIYYLIIILIYYLSTYSRLFSSKLVFRDFAFRSLGFSEWPLLPRNNSGSIADPSIYLPVFSSN